MDIEKIDKILFQIVIRIDGEEVGTGFYIDENLILTADHVIRKDRTKGKNIKIIGDTKGLDVTSASVLDYDEDLDIALLKVNKTVKVKLPLSIINIKERDKWRTYTCFQPLDGTGNDFEKDMIKGEVYQVEPFNNLGYDIHLSGLYLKGEPYYGGYAGCSGSPIIINGSIVGVVVKEEQSQRDTPFKAISFARIKDFFIRNNVIFKEIKEENKLDISFETIFQKVVSKDISEEYKMMPSINLLYDQYNNTSCIVIPKNIAMRSRFVEEIIKEFNDNDIFNIYGLVSSGKSVLAGLIVNKMNKYQLYVDLTGINISSIDKFINDVMKGILESKNMYNVNDPIIEQICKIININGVMMLDNFPLIKRGDKLYYFINILLGTCKKYGIKVIIISAKDIKHLRYESNMLNINYRESEPLTKDDILEILRGYNLKCNDTQADFFYGVTGGNVSLVYALFYYLNNNDWNLVDKFTEIITKQYAMDIRDDLQYKIMDFIEDREAKELLYRIALIDFPYNREYVQTIAEIEPQIAFITEKLTLLEGWILKHGQLYSNIPLLEEIAEKNLNSKTIVNIHKKIAEKLTEGNKCLDYITFFRVFTHLHKAKEYNKAGLLLVNAIQELNNSDIDQDYWHILSIWGELDPPSEMDTSIVLYMRVIQINCCEKFNIDNKNLLIKLDECIAKILEENKQESLLVLVLIVISFCVSNPLIALKYLDIIFQYIDSDTMERITYDLTETKVEQILYMCCVRIKNIEERELFFTIYDRLNSKQLENLNSFEHTKDATSAICNNIWMEEIKKQDKDKSWIRVLEELAVIERKAKKSNNKWLLIDSIKAQIIVYGEYTQDLQKAESIAMKTLNSELAQDTEVEFLIRDVIGRQFIYAKDFEKAKRYLDGITLDFDGLSLEKIDYLTQYSILNSNYDRAEAIKNLLDASEIISQSNLTYKEKVGNLGELIIEYWFNKDYISMFNKIKKYINIMNTINPDDRDDKWKSLFVCLGHCTGYFSSILETGKPPEKTSDGDVYVEPQRGMFINDNGNQEFIYTKGKNALIYAHMEGIAEFLGKYNDCENYLRTFLNEYEDKDSIRGIIERKLIIHVANSSLEESYYLAIESAENICSMKEGPNGKITFTIADLLYNDFIIPIIFIIIRKCIVGDSDYKKDAIKLIELLKNQTYIKSDDVNLIESIIQNNIINDNNIMVKIEDGYEFYEKLKVTEYISLFKWCFNNDMLQAVNIQNAFIDYLEKIYAKDRFLFNEVIKGTFLKFWTYAYCKQRYRFNNTDDIDKKFKENFYDLNQFNLKDLVQLMKSGLE
ncbi:serine protease [Clostridium estertheticum]|uniref:S1 family peptidase n=1 Tax=Clostridium estertheticum TaxID=238834 RepID=UPI001C0DB3BF|nr:serine protease [Clostridium estertheticum]MBU3200294.1 serine protease [Clostridium estertheticum]WAG64465.1 serine protease [Clostridium estertheticum]